MNCNPDWKSVNNSFADIAFSSMEFVPPHLFISTLLSNPVSPEGLATESHSKNILTLFAGQLAVYNQGWVNFENISPEGLATSSHKNITKLVDSNKMIRELYLENSLYNLLAQIICPGGASDFVATFILDTLSPVGEPISWIWLSLILF